MKNLTPSTRFFLLTWALLVLSFTAKPQALPVAPDLSILYDDTAKLYQDFGSGCAGIGCGDWQIYLDSMYYQCPILNGATVPAGADSSAYDLKECTPGHYLPGLVEIFIIYRGKVFSYGNKSVFDWGNTNCLAGIRPRRVSEPCMGICVGCLDAYYPKVGVAGLDENDKFVLYSRVNYPQANGKRYFVEQDYSNNSRAVPMRRTNADPRGAVRDSSAFTQQNLAALKRLNR